MHVNSSVPNLSQRRCYHILEKTKRRKNMKDFELIIGYEDVKAELRMALDTIKNPEKYQRLGVKMPRGVLLYGEPGVGKTVLAKSFLEASGRKYFICRKDKPNGDFVNEITETFEKAKAGEPCIILLDDMDKYANEDYRRPDAEEYVTIQSCIDDISGKDIFVMATANDVRKLPNSLMRAGRFDKVIQMNMPRGKDATEIVKYYLSSKETVSDVDPEEIARILDGKSCAELETVINEAGIFAGFDGKSKIDRDDLLRAVMRVIFNAPESLGVNNEYKLKRVAVHEAGHAVVAELLEPESVNLISINPHGGDIGGFTSYNNNEHYFNSISYMKERVVALLGGKAATEIVFAETDVGCNSDMHRAFDIVERFVDNYCEFGFDKFERRSSSSTLLEKKETFVHAELDRYYMQAKKIIADNRAFFDALVQALVEKKTLTSKDIKQIKSSVNH